MAPSGVRQDMFVDFIICFKYSRGSLTECVNEHKQWAKSYVRHRRGYIDAVLPFEFGPHAAKLQEGNTALSANVGQ